MEPQDEPFAEEHNARTSVEWMERHHALQACLPDHIAGLIAEPQGEICGGVAVKPWEKACPHALRDDRGGRYCHCHPKDSGLIPMTTHEMLEALRERMYFWLCPTRHGAERWWGVYEEDPEDFDNCVQFTSGPTPDDALRAALEALPPRR